MRWTDFSAPRGDAQHKNGGNLNRSLLTKRRGQKSSTLLFHSHFVFIVIGFIVIGLSNNILINRRIAVSCYYRYRVIVSWGTPGSSHLYSSGCGVFTVPKPLLPVCVPAALPDDGVQQHSERAGPAAAHQPAGLEGLLLLAGQDGAPGDPGWDGLPVWRRQILFTGVTVYNRFIRALDSRLSIRLIPLL